MATNVRDGHWSQTPASEAIYHSGKRWRISRMPRNSRFSVEFEIATRPPSHATGLKPAAPRCKISSLPRQGPPREHDEQGRHQDCDEDRDARSASAPAQSDFIQ